MTQRKKMITVASIGTALVLGFGAYFGRQRLADIRIRRRIIGEWRFVEHHTEQDLTQVSVLNFRPDGALVSTTTFQRDEGDQTVTEETEWRISNGKLYQLNQQGVEEELRVSMKWDVLLLRLRRSPGRDDYAVLKCERLKRT